MKDLKILGIDIGGTTLKFGVVSPDGEIVDRKKMDTPEAVKGGFADSIAKMIKGYLEKYPKLAGVGMGFPGLLSVDRKNVILLPNIPNVKNLPIVDILAKELPGLKVKIENDAKCATLGEFYFGENKGIENFVFITLGTGVGGGAIIHKELFIGARGNGMEVGHMIARNGQTLEQQIGLQKILAYAKNTIGSATDTNLNKGELTMHALVAAASTGDVYAKKVFAFVGETLGESLVSIVRVLDVDTILIGGGISAAFEYIVPEALSVMKVNLPPYYTDSLQIKKASLSNDAGILGAAGLILHEHQTW